MSREQVEEQLEELRVREDDLELQMDDCQSDIDMLEHELEVYNEHDDMQDIIDDDNAQRAADMNAALADIGGGW
jgi:hypothetical protein